MPPKPKSKPTSTGARMTLRFRSPEEKEQIQRDANKEGRSLNQQLLHVYFTAREFK